MVTSMAEALVRRVIPTGQRVRETDFVTALIEHAWRRGIDLTGETGLRQLVSIILEPPFPAPLACWGSMTTFPRNAVKNSDKL